MVLNKTESSLSINKTKHKTSRFGLIILNHTVLSFYICKRDKMSKQYTLIPIVVMISLFLMLSPIYVYCQ
ncbi:hypothetical protein XENTR_v10020982 [Xenopus tropicalis]|nr:hypothetical protein XENTR_v10020982 [Xenopus tropicalis]